MNINLKPEQEKFIQSQINSGKFTNLDQVIDAAFLLLEKLNNEHLEWIEETRTKIDFAITEIDKGEVLDGETVVKEILERFKQAS